MKSKTLLIGLILTLLMASSVLGATLNTPADNAVLRGGYTTTFNATVVAVPAQTSEMACTFQYSIDGGNTWTLITTSGNQTATECATTAQTPFVYGIDEIRVSNVRSNATGSFTETDSNEVSVKQYETAEATEAGTDIVAGTFAQIAVFVSVLVLVIVLAFLLVRLRKLTPKGKL